MDIPPITPEDKTPVGKSGFDEPVTPGEADYSGCADLIVALVAVAIILLIATALAWQYL